MTDEVDVEIANRILASPEPDALNVRADEIRRLATSLLEMVDEDDKWVDRYHAALLKSEKLETKLNILLKAVEEAGHAESCSSSDNYNVIPCDCAMRLL